ncbi:hypothetical protein GobsT_43920 [Gemmata obscuriglobus]|nr:hypothetical protein GobsT_43920 [Gemmata obscuriglobus]VTS08869.1 unnamed protein product [Gemmata obscuriglobus UQM 2246]
MRPQAARIGGPSPVAFTRGEVATTLRPPADPRRLQPPHGGGRTNSSPAPPHPEQRCVINQRAVSGAAPGSARSPPRFRATGRASRIRGARATGAGVRSTTDSTHRVAAHRRPPTTATRGDEPRPAPTGTTRSTTDSNRRVPTRPRPRPPALRGDEPRQPPTGTTRSHHRLMPRGPHAHRRPRAPERPGGRTVSSPAPPSSDERCVPNSLAVSGAAPGSACLCCPATTRATAWTGCRSKAGTGILAMRPAARPEPP